MGIGLSFLARERAPPPGANFLLLEGGSPAVGLSLGDARWTVFLVDLPRVCSCRGVEEGVGAISLISGRGCLAYDTI